MAWFLNFYQCEDCEEMWEDAWSCTVDDDCPFCGSRHMVPYASDDLIFQVVEEEGRFVVIRSPDSAEDSPDYEEVAEFSTRDQAEAYVFEARERRDRV
jgi:hypothetical protein